MANSSDEQGGGPAPKKPGSSRPSLLGSSGPARDEEDNTVSILSAVKSDPKVKRPAPAIPASSSSPPSGRSSRMLLLAGALVIAAGLFFVLRGGERAAPATQVAAITPASTESAPPVEPVAPPPAVPAAEVPAPQTATIETALNSDAPVTASAADPVPAPAAPSAAPSGKAAEKTDTTPAPAASGKAASAKPASEAAAKPVAKVAKSPVATPHDKARKSEDRLLAALNQSASPGKDSAQRDIDLIEALLEHSTPATNGKTAPAKPVVKALPAGPKVALASSTSREVVDRKSGASTAELIRKCEDFGVLEGLLCRIRICSGLWGKDAACPVQAAPPGVRP